MLYRKLALSLSLLPLLSGCDGGASYDTPGNPRPVDPPATRLIGTWRVRSYSGDGGGFQTCPSNTADFACTADTKWVFHDTDTFTDFNGNRRTYTFNGTAFTFFGMPATMTVQIPQLTDSVMRVEMNGTPNPGGRLSLLMEKQ